MAGEPAGLGEQDGPGDLLADLRELDVVHVDVCGMARGLEKEVSLRFLADRRCWK
jgi:hypothetical protein